MVYESALRAQNYRSRVVTSVKREINKFLPIFQMENNSDEKMEQRPRVGRSVTPMSLNNYLEKVVVRWVLSVQRKLDNMADKFIQGISIRNDNFISWWESKFGKPYRTNWRPKVSSEQPLPAWQFANYDYMSFNQTLKFIFQWAFYFLIEIAYAPPTFNMVEGCYDAWYLFVMQFLVIEDVNEEATRYPESDLRLVPFIEKFTFAYFTLLEFPYKQVAYCNQGIWDVGTKFSEVRDMILWDSF
jgi:hypothetical protein